jgi:large subunit ribosomal protein L21
MFAVIKNGGRQYKVTVGQRLVVNRLEVEDGSQIELSDVLLLSNGDETTIGAPFIEGVKVLANVDGPTRGPKLIVFKYQSKKRVRHRSGHRQDQTVLTITDIVSQGTSLVAPAQEEAAPAKPAKETKAKKSAAKTAPVAETESAAPEEKKTTRRRRTTKADSESASSTEE